MLVSKDKIEQLEAFLLLYYGSVIMHLNPTMA